MVSKLVKKKIIKTIIISTFIDFFSLIIVISFSACNLGTNCNLFKAPSEINKKAKMTLINKTFPYVVLSKFDMLPIRM